LTPSLSHRWSPRQLVDPPAGVTPLSVLFRPIRSNPLGQGGFRTFRGVRRKGDVRLFTASSGTAQALRTFPGQRTQRSVCCCAAPLLALPHSHPCSECETGDVNPAGGLSHHRRRARLRSRRLRSSGTCSRPHCFAFGALLVLYGVLAPGIDSPPQCTAPLEIGFPHARV
jgi:hypothetical protein